MVAEYSISSDNENPKTYETRLYFTYTVRENSLTSWGYGQYLADKFHDVRSIAR